MTSVLSHGWDQKAPVDPVALLERPLVEPVAVHHVLDGLAGFYASEASARSVARELRLAHGLEPTQLVLLGPADLGRLRFMRRARQWNRRQARQGHQPAGALWTSAGVGALLGALLVASLFGWFDLLPPDMEVVTVLLAALAGAMAGAGVAATLVRQQPQFRKFDRVVRRRLAAGEWVLVAHHVPWKRQAGVVSLVSRHSLDWYGVTSGQGLP